MQARRHPVIHSLNGHYSLQEEALRKAVIEGVAKARALLKGTAQCTRPKDEVDAVIKSFLGRR